jgi:hypothetical protein
LYVLFIQVLCVVVADFARAAARKAPRHVGAHAPESDDSDFHERLPHF